jgi:hypothetical protein
MRSFSAECGQWWVAVPLLELPLSSCICQVAEHLHVQELVGQLALNLSM